MSNIKTKRKRSKHNGVCCYYYYTLDRLGYENKNSSKNKIIL